MTQTENNRSTAHSRPLRRLAVVCGVVLVAASVFAVALLLRTNTTTPAASPDGAIDVPLGVEEAVVIRCAGTPLVARPYRRGASVNVRIARQAQHGDVRVYDVRYVVNLPGEFDLTEYLASSNGEAIENLPPFRVRGVTRLTKDMETRIREIEDVRIDIWHWYYESLTGLGVLWIAWLMGLIFIGRSGRRPPPQAVVVPPRTLEEQIESRLQQLADGTLTVQEKSELEVLLLNYWRGVLGHSGRLADTCRVLQREARFRQAYTALQSWLHCPGSGVDARQIVSLCRPRTTGCTEEGRVEGKL